MGAAFLVLLFPLVSCGGSSDEYRFSHGAAGTTTAGGSYAGTSSAGGTSDRPPLAGGAGRPDNTAGGDADAGGAGGDGGASGDGASAGGDAGSASNGGTAGIGQAGSGGVAGSAGAGAQKPCASITECPRPTSACLTAHCTAGFCVTENVVAGALYVFDVPADCHATAACDGEGHPTLVVEQDNTPRSNNPCLAGTCNKSGAVGTEPLHSGTPCSSQAMTGKCDGSGSCVACIVTADCPLGQSCTANHACIGQPCTDTNCGGACPACVVGKTCSIDGDCASNACDSETSLCVADHRCANHRQDANETDTDCGGGICPQCALGKACLVNIDCGSLACDALSHVCVGDTCVDHHMDNDESALDCGGDNLSCPRCAVGANCNSNLDCAPGHTCSASKECQ